MRLNVATAASAIAARNESMKEFKRYISITAGILLVLLSLCGAMSGKKNGVSQADISKSRYYYYEGLRRETTGERDAAYECYRKAAELDSGNLAAVYNLGAARLAIRNQAFVNEREISRSLSMLRRYVDAYPDDYDEGLYYGYVIGQSDTTGEAVRVLSRIVDRDPKNTATLIYLSQAYMQQGDPKKALEALDRYEREEGGSGPLAIHKMSLMMEAGDSAAAVKEINRIIAANPGDYTYRILKGNLYEVLEKPDSAEMFYREAEELAPESSEPKVALMEIYRTRGDSANYDRKVYEVLLTEDLDLEAKRKMTAEYLQRLVDNKNDFARGDTLFSVLERQYPHDATVQDLAARYSAAKGEFKKASEQISYAIDMDRQNLGFWQQKMYYQVAADNAGGAIETCKEAEKEGIADRHIRLYGAMLMYSEKKYDEARDQFRRVIHDVDSGLPASGPVSLKQVRRDITLEDLNFLSDAYMQMGDVEMAENDTTSGYQNYENALALNPDNAMAANNYAYFISLNGGDLDKALRLSNSSMKGMNADNPTYLDTYAWILYLQGKNDDAIVIQKKVLELMDNADMKDFAIYDHYGDMLAKAGKEEEALEYWRKALEQNPEEKDVVAIRKKIENAEKNMKK